MEEISLFVSIYRPSSYTRILYFEKRGVTQVSQHQSSISVSSNSMFQVSSDNMSIVRYKISGVRIRCQVSVLDIKCQVSNMSVSGKLNTEPQYHMSGNHRSCNMIQENSIVKYFQLFTVMSIKIIN